MDWLGRFGRPYWAITPPRAEPQYVLRTVRRLPPGTPALHPPESDVADLFGELVAMADDVDPRDWLAEHRSTECARIALDEELIAYPGLVPADRRPGGRRIDDARLAEAIARIRDEPTLAESRDPWTGEVRRITTPLISTLLAEPEAIADPVRWVARHRRVTAVEWALEHIKPGGHAPGEIGDVVSRIQKPTAWLRTIPFGLRLRIRSVTIGTSGFTLTSEIRHRPTGAGTHTFPATQWTGPDEITDNLGHGYLCRDAETGDNGLLRPTRIVRQDWYPAPAAGATELRVAVDAFTDRTFDIPLAGPAGASPPAADGSG